MNTGVVPKSKIVKPTPSTKKKMQHYFKIMMQLPKTKFTTSANDAKKDSLSCICISNRIVKCTSKYEAIFLLKKSNTSVNQQCSQTKQAKIDCPETSGSITELPFPLAC